MPTHGSSRGYTLSRRCKMNSSRHALQIISKELCSARLAILGSKMQRNQHSISFADRRAIFERIMPQCKCACAFGPTYCLQKSKTSLHVKVSWSLRPSARLFNNQPKELLRLIHRPNSLVGLHFHWLVLSYIPDTLRIVLLRKRPWKSHMTWAWDNFFGHTHADIKYGKCLIVSSLETIQETFVKQGLEKQ